MGRKKPKKLCGIRKYYKSQFANLLCDAISSVTYNVLSLDSLRTLRQSQICTI